MSKQAKGGSGALILLLLGIGCGGLVAMSPDIAMPLMVLLLPGLIFLLVDHSPGWGVARAILLFQAAACVNPVSSAWYACSGVDNCMAILATPQTVLEVWLAGCLAWLISQLLPIGLKLLNDMRLQHYRTALEARRLALRTEWGFDSSVDD
jgi:hypothetical protein